eukprot:SAG25_NODE_2688_length_1448_cov_3.598962_1_plen_32_part_10
MSFLFSFLRLPNLLTNLRLQNVRNVLRFREAV